MEWQRFATTAKLHKPWRQRPQKGRQIFPQSWHCLVPNSPSLVHYGQVTGTKAENNLDSRIGCQGHKTGKSVSWMFWLKQIESRQEEGAKLWKWQSQCRVWTRVKADTGNLPGPRSSGKVWTRLVRHQLFINATNGRQRSSPLIYITVWTCKPT